MIMFTGSTATGKKVMPRRAETLTPVSLELGGKDPMIVLRRRRPRARREPAPSTTRCSTAARRASRSSASTSRSPSTTSSSRRSSRRPRAAPGPTDGPGQRRRRLDDVPAAGRHRRAPRRGRQDQGRARARRRPPRPRGPGRLLVRADGPRRRRPHDGVHDRGDVRADAADHEGRRHRGGDPAGQRLAVRARRVGLPQGPRARRGRSPGASRPARSASTTR